MAVASDSTARAIFSGLRIDRMSMRNAEDPRDVMWEESDWDSKWMLEERQAHVKKHVLHCPAVTRTVVFSSQQLIQDFKMVQRVLLEGTCIEEWSFHFGFVIPGSTNEWDQTIFAAAEPDRMLPASLISGRIVVETNFFDGSAFIARTRVRVFYV